MTNKNLKLLLFGILGLAAVCVVAALGISLVFLSPQLKALFQKPIPTPACIEPKLSLGAASFRIQSLKRLADGSVQVPPATPGIAYWVEGTSLKYVFALSPTGENQNFAAGVKPGDPVSILWADCGAENYAVTGMEIGTPEIPTLLNQPASGFTLFLRSASSPVILVIHAERPELLVTPSPNPSGEAKPTGEAIQAEVTFDESKPSED